jgi:ADP-heptose:LPS heptosyltransferase
MTKKHYKKILIVNTFGIGDVLFTTPLIDTIKKQCPQVRIGYVANRRTSEMLKNNPLIDHVFVYERDDFHETYQQSKILFLKKAWAFLKEIRSFNYEAVLDLSQNTSTGFFMALAGIDERIGFDYKGRGKFLTQRVPLKGYEGKHIVDFYRDLLNNFGFKSGEPEGMTFP